MRLKVSLAKCRPFWGLEVFTPWNAKDTDSSPWDQLCSLLITFAVSLYSPYFMASSNGNIFHSPVNSPHRGQWRGALMFSLICAWINGWVNNGWWIEIPSCPLWRHCNVTTMFTPVMWTYNVLQFARNAVQVGNILTNVLARWVWQ